jgi:hypothetical protein
MKDEAVLIMQEYWDYLIILDACRYDYFGKFCKQYFSGRLEKRWSLGSSIIKWKDIDLTG